MQIVIDIPEEDYATIMSDKTHQPRSLTNLEWRIANGIPLPKGHGRLIDGDELESRMKIGYCIVRDAKTIIEADKED